MYKENDSRFVRNFIKHKSNAWLTESGFCAFFVFVPLRFILFLNFLVMHEIDVAQIKSWIWCSDLWKLTRYLGISW